jgi:hypothetical protein
VFTDDLADAGASEIVCHKFNRRKPKDNRLALQIN